MAASSSRLLNIRNSALHTLIRRHLLHSSASILQPSTPALLLIKNGGVHSSYGYSHRLQLGPSLMQIEAARSRTYVTKEDRDSAVDDDDDDEEFDDDDIEDYSGSDFDDSDESEDLDEDRDAK